MGGDGWAALGVEGGRLVLLALMNLIRAGESTVGGRGSGMEKKREEKVLKSNFSKKRISRPYIMGGKRIPNRILRNLVNLTPLIDGWMETFQGDGEEILKV